MKLESPDPAYADRMAVAVRAGHQVLGVIFVLCDRPRLVADADRVLADAARATALHLLRTRGSVDPGQTRRGEALRGLLATTLSAEDAAAVLGIAATTSVVVATIRPAVRLSGRDTAEAVMSRVVDLVGLYGEYWHPAAATVLELGSITLALPVLADGEEQAERLATRLRKLGTDLVTAARRSGDAEIKVAIGAVVPLAEIGRSRLLSEQVADVITSEGAVATLDDVRSTVVLEAVRLGRPAADEALLLPQVRALLRHDELQGTDYAQTLLVYLGCGGDMVATAAALNVHENTARYRMKRLVEMFGVDLSGDEALVTWLQVRSACGPTQATATD